MSAGTIALRLVIGGDSKGAQAALKGLGTAGGRAGKALKVAQTGAAIGLTAIVGIAGKGVQSYETLVKSAAALQRQSKISAEDASLLTGQWQRYGVAAEAGGKGVMMLSKQIDAANTGTKTSIDSFARLGITLDDLKTMSPYQVLEQVRQTLSEMPPSAERTAISAKLLGKGFMSMSKWIGASSTDLDALNQQLKDTGQVMDEAELAKAKDDMKQMALLQVDLRGLLVEVGRSAMPILRDLVPPMKTLLKVVKPLAPHLVEIGGALAAFLVVSKVATGLSAMVTALRTMKGLLVGGKLASGLAGVAEAGAGGGFVKGPGGKLVAQSLLPGAAGAGGVGSGAAAAGVGSLIVPVAVMSIAAAAAGAIYLGVKAGQEEAKTGGSFWDQVKAGLAGPGDWFYNLAGGPQADKFIAKYGDLTDRLAALPKTPQTAYLKADYQKAMHIPQVKAAIELGAPQTRAQLEVIRDAIVENLNVPIKEATRLTKLIFPQSWAGRAGMEIKATQDELAKLRETLKKKIAFGDTDTASTEASIKRLEKKLATLRANAARPAHTGRLNTDGWIAPLSAAARALASFRDLAAQGITPASMSSHKRWTAAHAPATPAWHAPGRALGGYVRRSPGGTLLRVGEGKYDEVVAQVLPGKGEQQSSGGETHFHLHIGQLIGTDERAARNLWNTVKPIAMSDMRMKMAMSRG